ncbi:MAG: hypothetical protein WAN43_11770 [Rhodomicrobium sp.]
MAALASYARQAKDEELLHKARRIQARALRRSGQLLEQIAPARGANQNIQEGSHPNVFTRTDAAHDVGFSEHQQKQAMRIANLPEHEFEDLVDSFDPPTITDLAERGTQRQTEKHVRGTFGTGENDWYTPAPYLEAAREVLGAIDLGPATSKSAQQNVQAREYFTREDDGLSLDRFGRVWLNPPLCALNAAVFAPPYNSTATPSKSMLCSPNSLKRHS